MAKRVLLVEDEKTLRGQLVDLLLRHGYTVDSAADAVSVLRKMGHLPDDVGGDSTAARVEATRRWLEVYAPDSKLRIEMNSALPEGLVTTQADRAVFRALASDLSGHVSGEAVLTEQEFKARIYQHIRDAELEQGPFFALAYEALLGRSSGPQLSSFLMSMADRAVPLLEAAAA